MITITLTFCIIFILFAYLYICITTLLLHKFFSFCVHKSNYLLHALVHLNFLHFIHSFGNLPPSFFSRFTAWICYNAFQPETLRLLIDVVKHDPCPSASPSNFQLMKTAKLPTKPLHPTENSGTQSGRTIIPKI